MGQLPASCFFSPPTASYSWTKTRWALLLCSFSLQKLPSEMVGRNSLLSWPSPRCLFAYFIYFWLRAGLRWCPPGRWLGSFAHIGYPRSCMLSEEGYFYYRTQSRSSLNEVGAEWNGWLRAGARSCSDWVCWLSSEMSCSLQNFWCYFHGTWCFEALASCG